jgi:acetolactate synthase-1/2/3 large subunit
MERVAEILSKELTGLFGITGSGSSWHLISLLHDKGVPYYPVCHEASAAIMAGAMSCVPGNFAASISIKGPGLANMVSGIANNYFEQRPALSMSEAFAIGMEGTHKRLDHEAMLWPVVKGLLSLNTPEKLPELLTIARREVCGPVHLQLADRFGLQLVQPMRPDAPRWRPLPCKKPALLLGSACQRQQLDFSDVQVPIFTTAAAKGVVDESLSQVMGVFTGRGKSLSNESILEESDCLIAVGVEESELLSRVRWVKVSTESVDDLKSFLSDKSWTAEKQSLERDNKWLPTQCFQLLNDMDYDYDLVCDVGLFCVVAEHLWQASPARNFVGSLNARFMGTGIPTAIGLAIASQRPCICVLGDGGISPFIADAQLALLLNLPIAFMYFSDGRYGSIGISSADRYQKAIEVNVPYELMLEAMGFDTYEIADADEFHSFITSWQAKYPVVVRCDFESTDYAEMVKEIRA